MYQTSSELHIAVSGCYIFQNHTRCCKNVFVVSKRFILLDVAKKHILIGCEVACKIHAAERKHCTITLQSVLSTIIRKGFQILF